MKQSVPEILTEKPENCFRKSVIYELLGVFTKGQLFKFDGYDPYDQPDAWFGNGTPLTLFLQYLLQTKHLT